MRTQHFPKKLTYLTRTCPYDGLKNNSFSVKFVYVFNEYDIIVRAERLGTLYNEDMKHLFFKITGGLQDI